MSISPNMMACAPVATVSMPDAQAMLIVCAGISGGSPARRATWRAGLGPEPACRPWPINTSPIAAGSMPARAIAARAATAPSSAGCTLRNAPP